VSVLAARPHLDRSPFLLTMADHVLGDTLMEKARHHRPPEHGATLLVDYKLDAIFDMADATKVRVENGRPRAIGKTLDDYNCVDTGVFVATDGLMEALSAVYAAKGDAALSDGIQRLMGEGRMQTLDIGSGFWQDVDTPEMLTHAEEMLLGDLVPAE
jgi:choline kinase